VAAEYDIGDNNEVFTLDGLGNTESVNVRDGNTITYDVNELTNRYASVGESGLPDIVWRSAHPGSANQDW